jgi:hypothetical protein
MPCVQKMHGAVCRVRKGETEEYEVFVVRILRAAVDRMERMVCDCPGFEGLREECSLVCGCDATRYVLRRERGRGE